MRLYTYHILATKYYDKDNELPSMDHAETFYNEKNAQQTFINMCNNKVLRWETVMEGNDDYILIAQAGGPAQKYHIMYYACPLI